MSCVIAHAQSQAAVPVANKIKIFVSGLRVGEGEQDLKKLFSECGEVAEVVVDGTCATVTFQGQMVKHVEELNEILLGGRKLRVARVLEEQLDAPDYDAPFYQAGGLAAPMPYNPTQAPFPIMTQPSQTAAHSNPSCVLLDLQPPSLTSPSHPPFPAPRR